MAPTFYFIILFTTIFFFISYHIITLFRSKNTTLAHNWPLVGTLPSLIANMHQFPQWLEKLGQEKGCTFWLKGPWFPNLDILCTADPSDVQYTSSIKYSNFIRGPKSKKAFQDVFRGAVFNSDDPQLWENQRRLVKGFFNHNRFNHQLDKIVRNKFEKGLIPILDHASNVGSVVDLQDMFLRYTHDLATTLLFGYDPGKLSMEFPEISIAKILNLSMEVVFYRHLTPEFVWNLKSTLRLGLEHQWSKAKVRLDEYLAKHEAMKDELLNKRREFQDKDEEMYLYKKFVAEERIFQALSASDGYVDGSIVVFFVAAANTTRATLTWFFWMISKHPEVESKIRDELTTFQKSTSKNPCIFDSVEDVKNLVYLHAAFCETLRLYPAVPSQVRYPIETDILPSGHKVNPETMILIPLYTMARMKSIWGEDCQEFKPERWIEDGGRSIKIEPSHKFFTFGSGPRACIGKDLSFNSMKAIAATILHNYDVRVVEDHDPVSLMSIVSEMKNGLPARITKRHG